MQVQTVRLERVFDVQRSEASRFNASSTLFSFEASGRKHYSVRLPGWPRVEAGDTVMAVLGRADNWQTLAGWKNLSSGETALPASGSAWHLARMLFLAVFVYAVTNGATTPGGQTVAFAVRIVIGLVVLTLLAKGWRAWRFRRLIESL